MKAFSKFPVPVVAYGPGSQPEADEANFLPMPSDMETFSMPTAHIEADPATLAAACELLEDLYACMSEVTSKSLEQVQIDLANVAPNVVELINQSLGHGEVSILVRGSVHSPVNFRIQEAVFAGIWRIQELSSDGVLQRDTICAGAIPHVVQQYAAMAASSEVSPPPMNDGIMNAPAILNELQDRSRNYRIGSAAHVVNLSLLPMSQEDMTYLVVAMGPGAVTILSRGYGNCRITSTGLAHVWWVQYFNSMDKIILDTLEVVDVPEVAQAAEEDYADSVERLGEWLAVMQEETV
jgi:hydrogenase-1 operon protein HyaF